MSDSRITVGFVRRTRRRERKRLGFLSLIQVIKRCFLIMFIIILIAVGVAAYAVYQKFVPKIESYYEYACKVVEKSTLEDFKSEQTSFIYDSRGNQIAKLSTDRDVNYVEYKDIPKQVVDAVVSIEDRRFWEHHGVDWLSTAKAGVLYLKDSGNIVRGGSTITQQLARNIYLNYEQKLERKFKEIFIALELEKRYTKENVLEYYLNNINFANGYYGIGAAAKGYFNKKVKDLTLEEIAFLIGIPNNPSYYDPINYPEHTAYRRNIILKQMWKQGYIGEVDYWHVSNSPIHFYKSPKKVYNYEASYSIDCAVRALMKKSGFTFLYVFDTMGEFKRYQKRYSEAYSEAKNKLYTGGYRVKTTIDPGAQKELQKSVNKTLAEFKGKSKDGIYEVQGAATAIDNATGKVIAIVGGRSQDFNGIITLNRAYQSYRQPGSTFKPLAVYTPAFEYGYTPNSVVMDVYSSNGPKNSGNSYDGEITIRHAVEKSKNVVAWNLFNSIGPRNGLAFVQHMGFNKIVPSDYYLSSALGGLTYGVTTVEMAGGYATLANDGIYREPTCVESIKLSTGETVVSSIKKSRVYSEYAARTMTDVLQGVPKNGTAKGLRLPKGMPIACKTGTTNGQTNGWFCGYTPYYTVACYVGYDMSKSLDGLWGSTYPLEIWKSIQTYLCNGKKVVAFKKPVAPKKPKPKPTKKPKREDEDGDEVEDPKSTNYEEPTVEPSSSPGWEEPSDEPTATVGPEVEPKPSKEPTPKPTKKPTQKPTQKPTPKPTPKPTKAPTPEPVEPEPEEPAEPEEPDEEFSGGAEGESVRLGN